MVSARKHAHYFRNVTHLTEVDVYRVLDLFGVTDQALGHAIKKLLAPGGRGAGKDFRRDVQEAIDTLTRRLEMLDEDATAGIDTLNAGPRIDVVSVLAALDVVAANAADDRWIPWGGGECPVPVTTRVQVEHRGGDRFDGLAGLGYGMLRENWLHRIPRPHDGDIIAYRVVRPA